MKLDHVFDMLSVRFACALQVVRDSVPHKRSQALLAALALLWAWGVCAQGTNVDPTPNTTRRYDVTIYIAPDGDDKRSGTTAKESVRTLVRVQDLLKGYQFNDKDRSVAVLFAPGHYKGLNVVWDFFTPTRSLVFEPLDYHRGEQVVTIDGTGTPASQFFLLRILQDAPDSAPLSTRITIHGLQITNYCEAISLGDWKAKANVAENIIEDNKFSRIGSKYQTPILQADRRMLPTGTCTAALRLQRASKNIVRNNVFEDIENLPAELTYANLNGPLLLHSIYIANYSSNNLIQGNRFDRFSGSPVRIRNQSDNNRIVDNTFGMPLYPIKKPSDYRIKAVSQWYCNDAVPLCKDRAEKGDTECPSVGTEITDNRVNGNVELYSDESQSKNSTCALPLVRSRGAIEPRIEHNAVRP